MDLPASATEQATPPSIGARRPADTARALVRVATRMAPVWPLEDFVAVNPYLGLAEHPFGEAAAELEQVGAGVATMPLGYYLDAVDDGRIGYADLATTLSSWPGAGDDPAAFVSRARRAAERVNGPGASVGNERVPTLADVASAATGHDWDRLRTDRVSVWAAAYFDHGQASWRSANPSRPLFEAWKAEAAIDRTPEIMGLRGFRSLVRSLPDDPIAAASLVLDRLAVPDHALDLYLHAVLRRMGGWAAFAARSTWGRAEPGDDAHRQGVVPFLVVLLVWEAALYDLLCARGRAGDWHEAIADVSGPVTAPAAESALGRRLVLQDAYDRAAQRRLIAQFATDSVPAARNGDHPEGAKAAARAQLVFCIDVRSEVLRRHLEAVAPDVDTLGFAGFFGIPLEYVAIGHDTGVAQCPVLLEPAYVVAEAVMSGGGTNAELAADGAATQHAAEHRRRAHHLHRAWKSFKMGAVSCFSFVGPVGLAYLPKLFTDGAGRTRPVPDPDLEGLGSAGPTAPSLAPVAGVAAGIPLVERVELAERMLRGMSLTDGFAPLVVLTGHGSGTVNNPYAAGLDCGACGGHRGDTNARVGAAVLNDPHVRAALAQRGIAVPADTWFAGAVHDTTADDVTLFDVAAAPASHREALAALATDLAAAGRGARAERAERLGLAGLVGAELDEAVRHRGRDWAQVRPEWGLAGCHAFVAARRDRTRGLDLGGRSFLHSYDWRSDEGFAVLELIMTAPMVVASWISLQYYASTVDNDTFGSGNKTLHNVIGKVGVLEGNGGDLRVGLPWQSVHDGTVWQHEPVRLNVIIEAPTAAINEVLAAHPEVRHLCDNGWLHLLAMDDSGLLAQRYAGGLRWEATGDVVEEAAA